MIGFFIVIINYLWYYILASTTPTPGSNVETEELISRRNAPYGEFALAVVKTYIWYIFSFTLIQVFVFDTGFTARLAIVIVSGALAWLTTVFSQSQKNGYGMRGWSNFRQATQPKVVLAILCWPIFAIWLLSWPGIKIYQTIKNQRSNLPDQQ